MSEFERELPPFRLAETNFGDDLQAVAARELGDANRWAELIWINSLIYPYLTDNEAIANDRILLTGSLIRVPAPTLTPVDEPKRAQVFGRDAMMQRKQLVIDEFGDFAVATGVDNLKQQLSHAITTPRGQLNRHPSYGCLIWKLQGTVSGPTAAMLGAKHVRATLAADYRVNQVRSSVAVIDGDSIKVTAVCEAIDGGTIDITTGPEDE